VPEKPRGFDKLARASLDAGAQRRRPVGVRARQSAIESIPAASPPKRNRVIPLFLLFLLFLLLSSPFFSFLPLLPKTPNTRRLWFRQSIESGQFRTSVTMSLNGRPLNLLALRYTQLMFRNLLDLASRPECFSVLTSKRLWTDPHVAKQMLRFHLDAKSALASRPADQIDQAVAWLDAQVSLKGRRVTDLGCGPGLYAERFHDYGAAVIGLDWSATSLEYAKNKASATDRQITYLLADYTADRLPSGSDLIALIYCDFCALSPQQRRMLLQRIREALAPGGRLAMDVLAMPAFEQFEETAQIEHRLMDGFWSASDYVGAKKTFKYVREHVTLERYLIVERDRQWSVYNWLQYFSPSSLTQELTAAGFEIERLSRGFSDHQPTAADELIMLLARAA